MVHILDKSTGLILEGYLITYYPYTKCYAKGTIDDGVVAGLQLGIARGAEYVPIEYDPEVRSEPMFQLLSTDKIYHRLNFRHQHNLIVEQDNGTIRLDFEYGLVSQIQFSA